jgi:nitroreductase
VQQTASSFGLQPYRVLMVQDEAIRAKLLGASWNQTQITDASHLFVFAVENVIDEAYISAYFDNLSATRNIEVAGDILNYKNFVIENVGRMPADHKKEWASKQAYLALGNLLFSASMLQIDVTPMEGFIASQYNEILGLESKGLSAVVVGAIGYRHADDYFQHLKKVRKPINELFETI